MAVATDALEQLLREHEALVSEFQRLLVDFKTLPLPSRSSAAHVEHRSQRRAFRLLLANHRLAHTFVRDGLV